MKAKPFHFKQFTIHQDQCAQKVGTDGVLLGAWTNCKQAKSILDIGSGTGLIALMLAQKSNATTTAIEIDETAATQCQQNFEHSPWNDRLTIVNETIQRFSPSSKFDLIVSNPPFFETQKVTTQRSTARSEQELTLEELLEKVVQLLSPEGKFNIVFPSARKLELIAEAAKHQLNPVRICDVKGNINSASKRVLIEFGFGYQKTINSELAIEKEQRHHYTAAYRQLCESYLTIF